MIDPLAMDKRPSNFLQRQQGIQDQVETGSAFWLTPAAGDARYIKRQGGATAERPDNPLDFEMFFDTDIGMPVWWDGSDWVDATGSSA